MRYEVPIREVCSYRAIVEADSSSEAMDKADELIEVYKAEGKPNVLGLLVDRRLEVIDAWPIKADRPPGHP